MVVVMLLSKFDFICITWLPGGDTLGVFIIHEHENV